MERKILTAADWSRRTHDGEKLDDATVLTLGEFSEVRKGADGGIVVTISTPTPDRYRDVVKVEGINLAAYARNPIVLLNHDYYGLPVARAEKTYIAGGALKSEPEFPAPEVYELGALVGRMVRAGYLNAASIGFRPTKSAWDEDRRGYDFIECDLLEWSVVGVPANPECLVEARSAGLDLAPMRSWLERAVSVYTPELALLPKETISRALQIASGNPVSVSVGKSHIVFAVGDRVKVKSGSQHMDGQDEGIVKEVSPETPYGIKFDGMPGVHHWYVGTEIEEVDETKAAKKTCPHCGAEMPSDAETCPKCDKPMKAATPPDLATLSATVTALAATVESLSKRVGTPAPATQPGAEPAVEHPATAVRGLSREDLITATRAAVNSTLAKAKN